jgi:hypothetical protein
MEHMLKLTIVLAKAATVRDGFLGSTLHRVEPLSRPDRRRLARHPPDFRTGAVGLMIEVPWDEADGGFHNIVVSLVKRKPQGDQILDEEPRWTRSNQFRASTGAFLAGGPRGRSMACPMPPARLDANSRYTVRVAIDGETNDAWGQDFYTVGADE